MKKRIVNLNVCHGQPTDGTGIVCIHLFLRDNRGSFVEPSVLHPIKEADGTLRKQQVESKPTRGRLACNPKRNIHPVTKANITTVTPRTDDPRAVTCTRCKTTTEWKALMQQLEPKQEAQLAPE